MCQNARSARSVIYQDEAGCQLQVRRTIEKQGEVDCTRKWRIGLSGAGPGRWKAERPSTETDGKRREMACRRQRQEPPREAVGEILRVEYDRSTLE